MCWNGGEVLNKERRILGRVGYIERKGKERKEMEIIL
jgi:hypothetical protein